MACFAVAFFVWALRSSIDEEHDHTTSFSLHHLQQDIVKEAPKLNIVPASSMESYLEIAKDIKVTLRCEELLAKIYETKETLNLVNGTDNMKDEDLYGADDFVSSQDLVPVVVGNAQHLFCLASLTDRERGVATPKQSSATPGNNTYNYQFWKEQIHCDAAISNQQVLLDLWSEAHSVMEEDVLLKVLQMSIETERQLVGNTLYLWSPEADQGLAYALSVADDHEKSVDYGGMYGLEQNLGPGKLFVDVGSCLGVTSMSVALLYPGTRIVSIEAASPNWLLQQLNWNCNDAFDTDIPKNRPKVILEGVGGQGGTKMAKFLWRPESTTSTRSWTPKDEQDSSDIELKIRLRDWHSVLAQAEIAHDDIDVLNCDCEGCEYNLIPSLSDKEFSAMKTVMGGIHWGYIPENKLPSSSRGNATHSRLCQHENFARTAKECCDFPDLPVISAIAGEVLVEDGNAFPPKQSVVRDVAGELCSDFDSWARLHHLHSITSDAGWFKLTSIAD